MPGRRRATGEARWERQEQRRVCPDCGGQKSPRARRCRLCYGKTIAKEKGTPDARGYITLSRPLRRQFGVRYLHQLIAQRAVGFPLAQGTRVVHKNGDRGDNRRDNLVVVQHGRRLNLDSLTRAECYRRLAEEERLTRQEIANRTGLHRSTVSRLIALAWLPDSVKEAGRIGVKQAVALQRLKSHRPIAEALRRVSAQKMTVRQTQEMVRRLLA